MIEACDEFIENRGDNPADHKSFQQIKLSVIVPVYNVESCIRRCLDSILAQTYQNLQIILVDDGSTDGSGEICDAYAAKDGRIQVIHKENGGIASARKAGVLHAVGEYTTNVDSDDWIEENAYEAMVSRLEEYHPDMLVFGYKKEHTGFTEEYRQGIKEGYYQGKEFWEAFNRCVEETSFFNQPIDMILWNKAIRTDMWKEYQIKCPDTLKKNVDDAVIFPCLLNMESVYVDTDCYYHYCVRKNSILWGERKEDFDFFVMLSEYLISSYRDGRNKDKMERKFLLYKLFYHLILDIPERMISTKQCMFYPKIKAGNNIIVYGKGVFANRLIGRINQLKYCNVVDNVDKADFYRVSQIEEQRYDFIAVAILNHQTAASAKELMVEAGVKREKILCIEKENLLADLLPEEVRHMWEVLEDMERV